jgi:hypothetical protein
MAITGKAFHPLPINRRGIRELKPRLRIGKTNGISAPASRERTSQSPHHPPADTPRLGWARALRAGARHRAAQRGYLGVGHAPQDGVGEG